MNPIPVLVQQRGPGKRNFENYLQSTPWQGGGVAGGGQARTGHGNWFMSMNPPGYFVDPMENVPSQFFPGKSGKSSFTRGGKTRRPNFYKPDPDTKIPIPTNLFDPPPLDTTLGLDWGAIASIIGTLLRPRDPPMTNDDDDDPNVDDDDPVGSEPVASTSNPEPFGSTSNPEPFGSTSNPKPFGSTSNPKPFGSTSSPVVEDIPSDPIGSNNASVDSAEAFGSTLSRNAQILWQYDPQQLASSYLNLVNQTPVLIPSTSQVSTLEQYVLSNPIMLSTLNEGIVVSNAWGVSNNPSMLSLIIGMLLAFQGLTLQQIGKGEGRFRMDDVAIHASALAGLFSSGNTEIDPFTGQSRWIEWRPEEPALALDQVPKITELEDEEPIPSTSPNFDNQSEEQAKDRKGKGRA